MECPNVTFIKPTNQHTLNVKPNQQIEIHFNSGSKPSTINLFLGASEKSEKLKVSDIITAPNEPGIYDYNIIPFWNRNKGQTWGMANYSFRLVVE